MVNPPVFLLYSLVLKKCLQIPLPQGFSFFGKEAAGNTAFMVPVICYAFTAFPVARTSGIGAGAGSVVGTCHRKFLLKFFILTIVSEFCFFGKSDKRKKANFVSFLIQVKIEQIERLYFICFKNAAEFFF